MRRGGLGCDKENASQLCRERVSVGRILRASRAKSGMSFHMGKSEKWLVTLEKKRASGSRS